MSFVRFYWGRFLKFYPTGPETGHNIEVKLGQLRLRTGHERADRRRPWPTGTASEGGVVQQRSSGQFQISRLNGLQLGPHERTDHSEWGPGKHPAWPGQPNHWHAEIDMDGMQQGELKLFILIHILEVQFGKKHLAYSNSYPWAHLKILTFFDDPFTADCCMWFFGASRPQWFRGWAAIVAIVGHGSSMNQCESNISSLGVV